MGVQAHKIWIATSRRARSVLGWISPKPVVVCAVRVKYMVVIDVTGSFESGKLKCAVNPMNEYSAAKIAHTRHWYKSMTEVANGSSMASRIRAVFFLAVCDHLQWYQRYLNKVLR